jgi:hypothetical protein
MPSKIENPHELQAVLAHMVKMAKRPGRLPSRQVLAAELRAMADRVGAQDRVITAKASMSEGEFWDLIEPYGWGTRTTDYKKIEKDLLRKLTPDQAEAMQEVYGKLSGKLYKALDRVVEGLGDDGFGDLIAHIIGMGRREYSAVLRDPELGAERARNYDFTESFSYALPSKYDYENLNVSKYLKWAKNGLMAFQATLDADDETVPSSWLGKIRRDLELLVKAHEEFIRTEDAYKFIEQEEALKKAAENVEKVLGKLGMGMMLPEKGSLEDMLKYASNKWATWNLLSDIRQYLMD